MSTSETDSDPEPVPTTTDNVSSLTTFAHLCMTRLGQPDSPGPWSVSRAVDTLATLDFRLIRKDTALHGLIQDCASTILVSFNTLLQRGETIASSCGFIPDITSIMRPSFLHLLFQYRRLFRVIAARDFKQSSAPLAIVCWVDILLAKLGDVATLIAAGLHEDHFESLPNSLKAQRDEDNLRAAMQLPDNWDMLPPMLLSERVSTAAKRLSIKLMLGAYILCPSLSGHDMDKSIHKLLSTFSEFVRQSSARVDRLRSASGPSLRYLLQQERLTCSVAISLLAAADVAQDPPIKSESAAAFRPQTMAAAMQLLRFVLNLGQRIVPTNALRPPDHLDVPTSVIVRWKIVPQWTWSVWLEYNSLYADTIMCLTTTYIQHIACSVPLSDASDLMSISSSDQAAVISVMVDLFLRFVSVLPAGAHSEQLPTGMMGILRESCRLTLQWIKRNLCGIQRSKECCKALIILFGHLSQNEQHFALNELVIECLALMRDQCAREAWKAATEGGSLVVVLEQSFIRAKTALSRDGLSRSREIRAVQLMQFLVVMVSKGVQPLNLDTFVDFMKVIAERALEMPLDDRVFLCETLLICLATANLSKFDFPCRKVTIAGDDEAIWRLGMGDGACANLFLISAFSLYITSTLVGVEPLTYLEGLERLLDVALLICSRHYLYEDEPLGLIVLPTICDALAHLLEHGDDATGACTLANTRASTLWSVLRSLDSGENRDPSRDRFGALLRCRLGKLCEMDDKQRVSGMGYVETRGEGEKEYELLFCRRDGVSHMLYTRVV